MVYYVVRLNDGRRISIDTNTLEIFEIKTEVPIPKDEEKDIIVECLRELKRLGKPI